MPCYPKWVYCNREDVTMRNMRICDQKREKAYAFIKAQEKQLGRKLNLLERNNAYRQFGC